MPARSKALSAAVMLALSPMPALGTEQILFPAYADPISYPGYWNTLEQSVSLTLPITTILNPDSGPDTSSNDGYSYYQGFIPYFQAHGGRVIGYIDSDTQTKPPVMQSLTAVEQEVTQYESLYPGINGIFVDDFNSSSNSTTSFYQPLYNFIKSKNPNWLVYINPGDPVGSVYKPMADVIVTYENTSANYPTYSPESWQSSYPASDFGNIAYSEPSVAQMQKDLNSAQANRSGYVYFTDYGSNTAYENIPTNWVDEKNELIAINTATPTQGTYLLVNSGDFNTAANWSTTVPNGIGAEADFTGSLNGSAATITSASTITLGKIVFNNSSYSFTLGGSGSLTMQVSTGSTVIDSQAGTHVISLPMNIASGAVFQAERGGTLLIAGPVNILPGESLVSSGAGTVQYQSSVTVQTGGSFQLSAGSHITALTLNGISRASVSTQTSLPTIAIDVGGLSIAAGSTLDLQNGELIVNNGSLSTLAAEVKSAYTSGLWTGAGITSSSAGLNATHLLALGTIQNSVTGSPAGTAIYTSFGSAAAVDTDVLVKYTYYGDTNLDGKVDGSDYTHIDNGFAARLTGWYNGDFNYDGVVNGSDYSLIDNAFNTQSAAVSSELAQSTVQVADVPEPACAVFIFPALILLRRRQIDVIHRA